MPTTPRRRAGRPRKRPDPIEIPQAFGIRVKRFDTVPAKTLKPHPLNWRIHPDNQVAAMRGALAEWGFADAVKCYENSDGDLVTLDGHLRAEIASELADSVVPVLILDLNDAEAEKYMASADVITGMARPDVTKLDDLMKRVKWKQPEIMASVAEIMAAHTPEATTAVSFRASKGPTFEVIVKCEDQAGTDELAAELRGRGLEVATK